MERAHWELAEQAVTRPQATIYHDGVELRSMGNLQYLAFLTLPELERMVREVRKELKLWTERADNE